MGKLDNRGVGLPALPGQQVEGCVCRHSLLWQIRRNAREAGCASVALCGLTPIPTYRPALTRRVEAGKGRASVSGVRRCGSPWACPLCGLRIAMTRASALLPQIRQREADGWRTYLITLTLRHHHGQRLNGLFATLSTAWGRLTSGRGWADLKRHGLEYVRGYDLTLGPSGWHPHIHIVLLIAPGRHSARRIAHAVALRWRTVLASLGAEALDIGQDVQKAKSATAAAAYAMTLSGVAEATSAAAKRARKVGAGRTALDLAVAAAGGDDHAAALWREYATATRGRRCVVVSQGLKLAGEEEAAAGDASLTGEGFAAPEGGVAADAPAKDEGAIAPEVVAFFVRDSMKLIDPHLGAAVAAASISAERGRAALVEALGPPGKHWHLA